MRHTWLYVFGLMLLGLIGFGTIQAEAVTGVGEYYATPSWDQTLPCGTLGRLGSVCPRFVVLTNMGSHAVLDQETGLVWEQSPSTGGFTEWKQALSHCMMLIKGNRMGWRLPTIQELASLIDPTRSSPPLPAAHPFSDVSIVDNYVSATTVLGDPFGSAWAIQFFGHGLVTFVELNEHFIIPYRAWCVRGGQGLESQ